MKRWQMYAEEGILTAAYNQVYTDHEQLLQEIEAQAIQSQQQISLVRQQIAVKQREIRMLDLTSKEVSSLPSGTNVYEGVGKM